MVAVLRRGGLAIALGVLLAGPGLCAPTLDVAGALAALGAPRAAERQAAERWLALHLDPSDLLPVALAAGSLDAESLRRLEIALGGDERHFELAALLAADSQVPARRLGEAALTRQASLWLGDQDLSPAPAMRVLSGLVDRSAPQLRLELEPTGFARLLDRLVRVAGEDLQRGVGPGRIEIVLDPQVSAAAFDPLVPGAPGAPPPQDGDLMSLLFKIASVQGLEIEGFGFGGARGNQAWVHLVGKSLAGRRDAAQLLADWSRDLLDPREARRRTGAARALATCGWSAPLAWLERRWLAGDGAALEGVLLAASRGRVVPSLASVQHVRELLAEADRALAANTEASDARAELVLHALAALPAFSAGGEDLRAPLLENFDSLITRARFLRVAALVGMGSAPAEFTARARAELAAPQGGRGPAYEFELCRLLATTRGTQGGGTRTPVARATVLFEYALARGVAATWVDWLRAGDLAPPAGWRDPAALPAAWGAWPRLLLAEAWLGAGEREVAGAHLLALSRRPLGDDSPRVVERLRRLAGGPLRAEFEPALLSPAAGAGGTRLALLAGLLPRERHAELLELLLSEDAGDDGVLCLGPLAVSPDAAVAERAREVLLGMAQAAALGDERAARPEADWAQAYERAWSELAGAGADGEADAWRAQLSRLLSDTHREDRSRGRAVGRLPLWAALRERRWPALAAGSPVPLLALESPMPRT